MFTERYMAPDMDIWQGRVDSDDNYDAFRWHQCVRSWNLDGAVPDKKRLGFALLGFCCDEGIKRNKGRAGAALGPVSVRHELANLPCTFAPEVALFDAGNIVCTDGNLAASQQALAEAVQCIRTAGMFPLVIGGGHEVALGDYLGHKHYVDAQQGPDIGIVNFDAHFDLRPQPVDGSSGTMFRQIADLLAAEGRCFRYFCIGIQRSSNTLELFKTARRLAVTYLLAGDIASRHDEYVLDKLDEFILQNERLYVTVCTDVFSSAFAPGVSAPQPLGLNPEDVLRYIKHVIRTDKVVGFDIAEVSPRFDRDHATASLAKVLLFSVVDTVCRQKGLGRGAN